MGLGEIQPAECYMDGYAAGEEVQMSVKAILVRRRKERRAIDEEISALEKIGAQDSKKAASV